MTKAAAGSIGMGSTYVGITTKEGFDNLAEAKALVSEAEQLHEVNRERFDAASNKTAERLEDLLQRRIEIYVHTIRPSIELVRQVKEVNESGFQTDDTESILAFLEPAELENTAQVAYEASRLLNDAKVGLQVMHSALSGTLALVSQFGIASTGAPISTLSGVAATNAKLAYLGGGALKAGGGGVALGTAVVGSVVVGAAAITMAYRFASDSEKTLTEAHRHYAAVAEEAARFRCAASALRAVDRRIRELKYAVTRLSDLYMRSAYPRLERLCMENQRDDGTVHYPSLSDEDKQSLILSVHILKSLKQVISAPVLDDEGCPSLESSTAISAAMHRSNVALSTSTEQKA